MTATVHSIGAERAPSLEPMLQLVAADLNHVNAVILERMQSEVTLIPELAGHLIAGGGASGSLSRARSPPRSSLSSRAIDPP
jgi:octaprenyl-diphosphate synthase